ncbi:MAG: isoprenylcysteine carboxylmethyltransferase family protein [Fretibacterium sp.]|nr:isoprenylcysteine carboxylmethyltransferase family protein [Fretibacterium sp.]
MSSLRAFVFRMRGGLWTLLFCIILALARVTRLSFLLGLPFVILGQIWRFWAAGSIGRYRGERVGAEHLVTWGPYALMRNPLYFGNGLIGLGWALMSGPWAICIFVAAFALLYLFVIIPHEESFLHETFGTEYQDYRSRTGSFFPKTLPERGRLTGPFSFSVLRKSERHTLWTTLGGTFLIGLKGFFL